ncbi:hypothetical protein [Streptacidiphilus sp. P02-A3a]|uniref:hypothetical protein n=1 Tax=Streptacidiphilus sp. P02-A3a TaxID=2704468 RepID=UPI0015FC6D64|nr:hypothetical protein [Streptacidiphilus sp. P02-A3a]QMU67967.1 hypothetical protein GXP74_06765 [Streptacidiphilus sp. P02-A3a]
MSRSSGTAAVVAAVLILCASSAQAAVLAGGGLSALTVAHRVLGADGGSVTARVPGGRITLEVPPDALRGPTDVRITTASADGVDRLLAAKGLTAQRTIAAVGLKAYTLAGDPIGGTFAKPLVLTLVGRILGAPVEQVVQLNLPAPRALPALLSPGRIRIMTDGQPDLAVIAPKGAALLPSATRRATGPAGDSISANSAASSMDARARAAVTGTDGRIGKPPSSRRLLGAAALSLGTALAVVFLHRRRPLPRG